MLADLDHFGKNYEHNQESQKAKKPWMLSWPQVKLVGLAGTGFFVDAYDLFIINQVAPMLAAVYFPHTGLPAKQQDLMKAAANIGCVVGQVLFGLLADAFGRKAIYGKELMVIIIATIFQMSSPAWFSDGHRVLTWITICRIFLGIGIGGDYPMSATVVSDRANIHRRGTLLTFIFANQGWGSFVGSLVTIVTLEGFKGRLKSGHTQDVDKIWRILIGLSLIPAFGTLYQRLTLPESRKFELTKAREGAAETGTVTELPPVTEKKQDANANAQVAEADSEKSSLKVPPSPSDTKDETHGVIADKKAHWKEFIEFFSTWNHLRLLLGSMFSWFLVDIAFYGINLNQSVVLAQIGYDGKKGDVYDKLFSLATGNIIVTSLGFLPGYYFTLFLIDIVGRKKLQYMGFAMSGLFLAILAGEINHLGKAPLLVCFTFMQFFFNFGANTTTFIVAAELFPTRIRASAHGISAAAGKCGAILSSLVFNQLKAKIGTSAVLWIFFATCIAG
ncbi:probable PHO84-Inorganic phosphate permease [Serendipita indica DSM 11827]|uniref:Probable PHO84-Inorganic phosphate permease n=1 Tax=Serendipita indica (strain DSM 11827) TaxID=1109443 RepID=G4TS76_SERID|nr:probable PHO84-Inorganic phosphate permease [Serendipita indica DSM 11827]